jgi:hypothetical protein
VPPRRTSAGTPDRESAGTPTSGINLPEHPLEPEALALLRQRVSAMRALVALLDVLVVALSAAQIGLLQSWNIFGVFFAVFSLVFALAQALAVFKRNKTGLGVALLGLLCTALATALLLATIDARASDCAQEEREEAAAGVDTEPSAQCRGVSGGGAARSRGVVGANLAAHVLVIVASFVLRKLLFRLMKATRPARAPSRTAMAAASIASNGESGLHFVPDGDINDTSFEREGLGSSYGGGGRYVRDVSPAGRDISQYYGTESLGIAMQSGGRNGSTTYTDHRRESHRPPRYAQDRGSSSAPQSNKYHSQQMQQQEQLQQRQQQQHSSGARVAANRSVPPLRQGAGQFARPMAADAPPHNNYSVNVSNTSSYNSSSTAISGNNSNFISTTPANQGQRHVSHRTQPLDQGRGSAPWEHENSQNARLPVPVSRKSASRVEL